MQQVRAPQRTAASPAGAINATLNIFRLEDIEAQLNEDHSKASAKKKPSDGLSGRFPQNSAVNCAVHAGVELDEAVRDHDGGKIDDEIVGGRLTRHATMPAKYKVGIKGAKATK